MTSPVSAIEAIEKAMEGVTTEEWIVNGDRFSVETNATYIPDQKVIALCATGEGAMARSLYIASCNPVAMREVLAASRKAEALQREMAELRAMLERCAPAERSKSWLPVPIWNDARALLGGDNAE